MNNCLFACCLRSSKPAMIIFVLLLMLGTALAPVTQAQTTPAIKPAAPATGSIQQPGILQNPARKIPDLTPAQDGKITNVTFNPADQWRTGTTVQIFWTWPGFENSLVNVTIWRGSTQIAVIAANWKGGSVNWIVPYNLTPAVYTVKVNSAKNPSNSFGRVIRIDPSTLYFLAPKRSEVLTAGRTYAITWGFQGKPGPLKLELFAGSATTPTALIANNIAWGELGAGKYNWTVPTTLNGASNYWIKATSLASSVITNDSEAFTIQPLASTLVITDCTLEHKMNGYTSVGVFSTATLKNIGSTGVSFANGQAMARSTATTAGEYIHKAFGGGQYIAPNGTVKLNATVVSGKPAPGPYTITWEADPGNLYSTGAMTGKTRSCNLTIAAQPEGPKPDLTISDIVISPPTGAPSTVFNFTIYVKNIGQAATTGGISQIPNCRIDGMPFDGPIQSNALNIPITPGSAAFKYVRSKTGAIPGTHSIQCTTDRYNEIYELNEDNNSLTKSFVVQ